MTTTEAPRRRRLSRADVERLLDRSSVETRVETMAVLVGELDGGTLEGNERRLALEILHCFAGDAEVAVREAVAWQIHNSPLLTPDLADRLVDDVARVAFPVLRHADGLDDAVLLRVLAQGDPAKQLAVAGRRSLSAPVSEALAREGGLVVVTCLLRNEGADLGEPPLGRTLDRFGRVRAVQEAMAARPGLPLAIVERLVAIASDAVRAALVARHRLAPSLVEALVARGREAATIALLRPILDTEEDVAIAARWLHANDRITPSFLFRALCAGDVVLFDAAIALAAGLDVGTARLIAWDDGSLGLPALFRHCRFPTALVPPFRTAVRTAKELGYAGGDAGRDAYQSAVIARVFETCLPTSSWAVDDLLLQVFDQKSDAVIDRAMAQAGLPFLPLRG
jgi:uncharacterized protein (DUF2336 family)